MNDNTIIRIKVPARLYESVKARLMIKENYEAPVEETETLEESPIVDVITALSGVLGLGLTGVAITKAQDLLKKKNPELFDKLQSAGASMKNQGAGLNEAKKVDPKKAAEEKKKKEAEDKKKADEKKKKEAEAKKKKMEEAKDTEKATPADLERAKKINNHYNKKAKDDYDNTTRMISLARAGKIGPAKTKK